MTARSTRSRTPGARLRPEISSTQNRFSTSWLALAIIVSGLAVYANSLHGPFIFDDQASVTQNPHILHLWPLSAALSAPPDTPTAGRPLVSLSLAINYAVGGLSPWGYHLWNLGVHLLCGLVLFGIVRRTLTGRRLTERFGSTADPLAFACALIWLVHPVNTEVVDYVSQRTESMMGVLYLSTLYAAIRAMSVGEHSARWSIVSVAACALGMACKESMVTAPVMVLLYDAVFEAGSVSQALRRRWRLYAGLATAWMFLAVLILNSPVLHSKGLSSDIGPWTYLLNQSFMVVTYLRLAVWPHPLILDYGLPKVMTLRDALPSAAIIFVLLAATVAAWRWRADVAFLSTWVFITLSPTSTVIPIATEVGAERRMYLALAAIVVLVVLGARGAIERAARAVDKRWLRPTMGVTLACVVLALSALTVRRNMEYRDPLGLWQTLVDRHPHARAHYGLGLELGKRDRRAEATSHLLAAAAGYPKAYYALGVAAEDEGRHQDAVEHFREYVRLRPLEEEVIVAYTGMAHALAAQGKFDEATAAFDRVLFMQPRNVDVRLARADVFRHQERFDDAIREYGEYLLHVPNSAVAHTNLGLALIAGSREQEALTEFSKAVELDPNDPAKHENRGLALAALGRFDEAIVEYQRTLALAPDNAPVESALGTALLGQGKSDQALAHFQRALELDSANERVRMDVAAALRKLRR